MTASKWNHFTLEELTCHCGCGRMEMDDHFMKKIVELRERVGFALPVTSGYRCPEYNNRISHSGFNGPHTTGRAIDFLVMGSRASIIIGYATEYGMVGIGLNQKGAHEERFIHMDNLPNGPDRPRPWVWTY